jgi:hypothetical protein
MYLVEVKRRRRNPRASGTTSKIRDCPRRRGVPPAVGRRLPAREQVNPRVGSNPARRSQKASVGPAKPTPEN